MSSNNRESTWEDGFELLTAGRRVANLGPAQTLFPNGGQSAVLLCLLCYRVMGERFASMLCVVWSGMVCLPFSAPSPSPTSQAPGSSSSSRLEAPDSCKRWAICVCIHLPFALTCSPFSSDLSSGSDFPFFPPPLLFLSCSSCFSCLLNKSRKADTQTKETEQKQQLKKDALTWASQYE